MKVGRRSRFGVAALLALVVVGGAALRAWRSAETAWLDCPPLGRVRVTHASFGSTHPAPPRWRNQLLRRIPSVVREPLGLGTPRWVSSRPGTLVLWLEVQRPPAPSGLLPQGVGPALEVEWEDTLGFRNGPSAHNLPSERFTLEGSGPGSVFVGLGTDLFPRGGNELRAWLEALGDSTGGGGAGLFVKLPNPAARPRRLWTPDPLPAEQRAGGVGFTLRRLEVSRPPMVSAPTAEAVFGVKGPAGNGGWRLSVLELSDPGGNRLAVLPVDDPDLLNVTQAWSRGELLCRFPWPLWSDESAWRVTTEWVPTEVEALTPEEAGWRLREVALPADDQITMIGQRRSLAGIEVSVLALVGEHATLEGREHDVFGQATLELDHAELPSGWLVQVLSSRDAQGREVPRAGSPGDRSVGLRVSEGARHLEIDLAVLRRRRVEFVMRPGFH